MALLQHAGPVRARRLARDAQATALASNVKAPLVYTKVVDPQLAAVGWARRPQIMRQQPPLAVKLDYPVSHRAATGIPRRPEDPMVLHLVHVPTVPGIDMRPHRPASAAPAWLRHDTFADSRAVRPT